VAIDPANPLDSNGDLLDDRWQTFYGISDPNGDSDGDSLPNLREFLRGSNPLEGRPPAVVGDTLPLAWTPDAGQLLMTWSESRQRWEWIGLLPAGPLEFKFATGPGWLGENHGRGDASGLTDTTGTASNIAENILVSGRHRFNFNDLTRTYSFESFPLRNEWREKHALPVDGKWTDDTDGDGMNDLLEYALGGDPRQSAARILGPSPRATLEPAQARSEGQELIFSWIQIADPDVQVTPAICGDLAVGDWAAAIAEDDPDQTGVHSEHVRKMLRLPRSAGRIFLRLDVVAP
jgi:hypothetical protein